MFLVLCLSLSVSISISLSSPFFVPRYYIDKYNLAGEVLPHTAIIDPRTGTQLLKVVGFVEPEDLSMAIVEFMENNSLDQVRFMRRRWSFRSFHGTLGCGIGMPLKNQAPG